MTGNPSAAQNLQDALQKADKAISQLNENSEGVDKEAAAILAARYQELKERQQRLAEAQKSLSAEQLSKTTPAEGTSQASSNSPRLVVKERDDGKIDYVVYRVPGDPSEGTYEYTFDPHQMDDKDRIDESMKFAEELNSLAMASIADYADSLEDHQVSYLADAHDRLASDEKKIQDMRAKSSSAAAVEIAVQLYFSDTLRFFEAIFLIIKAKGGKV